MKIVLIQPKMNKRPMDTDLKTRMSPSLALLTLIRLTPNGHEVVMVNENVQKIDYDCGADLVGITVTLDVMPRACQIAAKFQSRGAKVVAGGIHVTCSPKQCLPQFDAICIGFAERVWARIVEDAANGSLQRIYQDADGFLGSEIASPAYDKADRKRYLYTNVITTSRGCPNRCDFCYNSAENRGLCSPSHCGCALGHSNARHAACAVHRRQLHRRSRLHHGAFGKDEGKASQVERGRDDEDSGLSSNARSDGRDRLSEPVHRVRVHQQQGIATGEQGQPV